MIRSFRGRCISILFLATALSGCMGAMTAREAQDYANRRMASYCADRCGPYRITGSQRLTGRWLVDFDTPARKLAVMVDDNGNTKLTVWDKTR